MVSAVMQSANDTNWFKVTLTAGTTYDFTENGLGAGSVNLEVFSSADAGDISESVGTEAPLATGAETVNFTADKTGSYYVEVRDLVYDETGSYTLSAVTVPDSYTLANPAVAPTSPAPRPVRRPPRKPPSSRSPA